MMNTSAVVRIAQEQFSQLSNTRFDGVIGCSKTEEGWLVSLEAVHKKAIPDSMDILGLFQIRLDCEGNVLGFDRKSLRRRCDVGED